MKMSSMEDMVIWEKIEVKNGQLKEVIKPSTILNTNAEWLSETLVRACYMGQIAVVHGMVGRVY